MYDQRFSFAFIPKRYSDRIQQSATLDRIYHRQPGGNQDQQIVARIRRVIGQRRMALDQLREVGWSRGGPDTSVEKVARDFQFLRNCPPTWAKVNQPTRCCRLDHFCPFCYARWMRKMWLLLIQKFPQAAAQRESGPSITASEPDPEIAALAGCGATEPVQYDLIVRARSANLPFSDSPEHVALAAGTNPRPATPALNLDFAAAEQWLREYLKQIPQSRRRLIAGVRSVAGPDVSAIVSTIVVPTTNCWRITTRTIFVIPRCAEFPEELCQGCDWCERITQPSHSQLHKTVSKLLAYPRALLRADPRLIATMLRARHRVHLNATLGGFYNSSAD